MRGAHLTVDLGALRHNYRIICDHINDKKINKLCVIKANAYGAGALQVAKALEDENADYFAVATLEEGVELRKGKIQTPIIVLGYVPEEDFSSILEHDLTLTVYEKSQASALNKCAKMKGGIGKIHLKIDTGLGRLGFYPGEEVIPLIKEMMAMSSLMIQGIFTHFAVSYVPKDPFTKEQCRMYSAFLSNLEKEGISFPLVHAANSGGILFFKDSYYDMVRIGIILYGISPSLPDVDLKITLSPIYSIHGAVGSVKELPENHSVGYGRGYMTGRPTKVALIPLGYVDGIPKRYEKKGEVLIHGTRCPVVGGIAMDQFIVDVSHIKDLKIGDAYTLLGSQGSENITVEEVAQRSETNVYEIISRLGSRLPRIFIDPKSDSSS